MGWIRSEGWLRAALGAGKHVVTANKQLIAYRGAELFALAAEKGVQLLYGAAVAGGVPVIPGIAQGLERRPDYAHQRDREWDVQLHPELDGERRGLRRGAGEGAGGWAMRRRIRRRMWMGSMRGRSCASWRGWRCMRRSIRRRCRRRRFRRSARWILRMRRSWAARCGRCRARSLMAMACACACGADAGAEDVADCVVAWDAEYGGDERAVWRRCGVQRARRGRASDGGCGDERCAGGGAGQRAGAAAGDEAEGVSGDVVAPHYLRFVVADQPGIVAAIAGALAKVGANIDSILQHRGHRGGAAAVCGDDGAESMSSWMNEAVAEMAGLSLCWSRRCVCRSWWWTTRTRTRTVAGG